MVPAYGCIGSSSFFPNVSGRKDGTEVANGNEFCLALGGMLNAIFSHFWQDFGFDVFHNEGRKGKTKSSFDIPSSINPFTSDP